MQNQQTCPSDLSPQPLVSFIVTTYNLPVELLRACLDSIVGLQMADGEREIILVDDGSKESPIGDLQEYREQMTYVRQGNQGLGVARNTGLDLAKGQYVQFVDGDDCLIPQAYERCLDVVRSERPDIVFFEQTSEQSPLQTSPRKGGFREGGFQAGCGYMLRHNVRASACGYLFRASTRGSLRFTPGLLHEDEEFTPMLLLRAESVISVKEKAYYYRKREGSIVQTVDDKAHVKKRLGDLEQVLLRLQNAVPALPEAEQAALGRRIAQLTMDYLYRVASLTGDSQHLENAVERLKKRGLFPLPDKAYTTKYALFRWLTSTTAGRKAMVRGLKLKSKS